MFCLCELFLFSCLTCFGSKVAQALQSSLCTHVGGWVVNGWTRWWVLQDLGQCILCPLPNFRPVINGEIKQPSYCPPWTNLRRRKFPRRSILSNKEGLKTPYGRPKKRSICLR